MGPDDKRLAARWVSISRSDCVVLSSGTAHGNISGSIFLPPSWDISMMSTGAFGPELIIGPESDHWECLSLTDSLTHSLTHWLLFSKLDWCNPSVWRCQLKLVDVLTVADEDRVGNNLLQIWKLRFGQKANLLFREVGFIIVKVSKKSSKKFSKKYS